VTEFLRHADETITVMTATVSVIFNDGKFRIKVIDESTGRPPSPLAEFYNEPYQVEIALENLGLDRDRVAYLMLACMGGQATLTGVPLTYD
jgi:hypothetical protein